MRITLKLNERTKLQLNHYMKYHRGNAILFGERHLGKHLAALELAKILLCERKNAGDCESCAGCQTSPLHNLDFMEIVPENGCIKVEQIRQAIDHASYKSVMDSKKVFVIDDADTMSEASQNALLKIMEDGEESSIFLLVAHRPLLKTVSSRGMLIHFFPPDTENAENPILRFMSEGKPGIAERYKESEFLKFSESFMRMLSRTNDRRDILKELGELREKNQDAFFVKFADEEKDCFLSMLEKLFRGALCLRSGISCTESISDIAAHVNELYDMGEISAIAKEAMFQKQKLRQHKYGKNDFFYLVMMLGGNGYVI